MTDPPPTTEQLIINDDHRRNLKIILDAGLPAITFAITHPIKTKRHLDARNNPFPAIKD